MHCGAARMRIEHVESQRPRHVRDDSGHRRGHGRRDLRDGVVGDGDDEQIDTRGGLLHVVFTTEHAPQTPAGPPERGGQ